MLQTPYREVPAADVQVGSRLLGPDDDELIVAEVRRTLDNVEVYAWPEHRAGRGPRAVLRYKPDEAARVAPADFDEYAALVRALIEAVQTAAASLPDSTAPQPWGASLAHVRLHVDGRTWTVPTLNPYGIDACIEDDDE